MPKHIFTQEEIQNINKGYYDEKLSLKQISEKYNIGLKLLRRFIQENNMSRSNIAIEGNSFKDETGKIYGRLTVIKKLDKRDNDNRILFLCKCICGNAVEVSGKKLRTGNTKSCGCLQKDKAIETLKTKTKLGYAIGQDLIGKRFGKLTVLKEVDSIIKSSGKPMRQWLCHCDCGNDVIVQHVYLTTGDTQSCRCINSQGESQIEIILQENNIPYIKQYIDKNLNNFLRFDFAILDKELNISHFIEFDGEQHYQSSNGYFSEKQVINDLRKNEYCLTNNIKLIRIPYNEKDKINMKLLFPETTKPEYIVSKIDHYNCYKKENDND